VAQTLAQREQEQINPNREMLGLGASNVVAALAGGLPVTGGLSRSVVNYTAGARSPLSGVVSASLLVLILIQFSMGPYFARLPVCVLAASIIAPMLNVLEPRSFLRIWRYAQADGLSFLATALGVLIFGVEIGIALGIEGGNIGPAYVPLYMDCRFPFGNNKSLLSYMVYAGKQLYLKDVLLPECSDVDKIGYTLEQITWCQENESYMWRHFMQEQLLYSTDSKLTSRFINTAPFSKFYLEIDNESPGRVGTWVGWQIVRSYMNNNDVNLQQLLQMDPIEIFQNSKYKPKK
jgi:hypothetical protein